MELQCSWTSLLSNIFALGAKKSQLYIWAAWRRSFNNQTNDDFFAVLLWSLEALFDGRFPHRDWRGLAFEPSSPGGRRAGQWLADGWRGILVASCGDLDYMSQFQAEPIVGTIFPRELNGGQQHGPLLPGGTGRIEA